MISTKKKRDRTRKETDTQINPLSPLSYTKFDYISAPFGAIATKSNLIRYNINALGAQRHEKNTIIKPIM